MYFVPLISLTTWPAKSRPPSASTAVRSATSTLPVVSPSPCCSTSAPSICAASCSASDTSSDALPSRDSSPDAFLSGAPSLEFSPLEVLLSGAPSLGAVTSDPSPLEPLSPEDSPSTGASSKKATGGNTLSKNDRSKPPTSERPPDAVFCSAG